MAKFSGQAREMVDLKWAVRIKRWKVKDRWSIETRVLEWKSSLEIVQKSSSIQYVTLGNDQVNTEIVSEINNSAIQISDIVPSRPIWTPSK